MTFCIYYKITFFSFWFMFSINILQSLSITVNSNKCYLSNIELGLNSDKIKNFIFQPNFAIFEVKSQKW